MTNIEKLDMNLISDMREITKCLKALANERRLKILAELNTSGSLTVNVIARRIDLSLKSTSKHVQKLADCDLILREQKSLQVWCSLNRKHPLIRSMLPHLK